MQPEVADNPPPAASGAPLMSFAHVSKTFPDGTDALTDITFDVRAGEFVTDRKSVV